MYEKINPNFIIITPKKFLMQISKSGFFKTNPNIDVVSLFLIDFCGGW